jgi:hypothetical protein
LIKKLDFHYALRINLNDKFQLNNDIVKAIHKILKKHKDYINSTETNFQILVPENFNINEIVDYEICSPADEIINKTITYKIKNSEKIPFRFKNNNLHCFVKFNGKKASLLELKTYDLLEFANFILAVETVKSIKIKGTVGPSKAWWIDENLLKEKILYQIKEANRQFKDFKKNKINFYNLETVLLISIKNMYLDSLIYDKESLDKILSEIFNQERFSVISCISFLTNEKIINSFINNNYSFDNDLKKKEIIELLES